MNKNIADIYPLSPMQEGMLFHTLYEPGSGVYVEQFSCELSGEVELGAFKRAWEKVVNGYEVLRSSFIWKQQRQPLQVVRRQVKLEWAEEDWSGQGGEEQQRRLQDFLREDRRRGFDLERAPLMRFRLLETSPRSWRFIWSHHHILLDGWSTPLVMQEVLRCYEGLKRGQEVAVRSGRPYREYIRWLQAQDLERAQQYWRGRLAGFSEPNALKSLRSGAGGRPGSQARTLSVELSRRLQQLGREGQVTMNTLVQGAWALLVGRYSGREEVVFGATVSGRPTGMKGVETMVGVFINTLPVRVGLGPEQEVLSWLKQLQSEQLELRQYEYSPLAQVQGWSEVPAGTPLFESIVVFENYPVDAELKRQGRSELQVAGVSVNERTNYPLTVVAKAGREWELQIDYDGSWFDAETIERMLRHYERLLEEMVQRPQARLSELAMMSEAERRQVLEEWNDTRREYPRDKCIHELFEEQVERRPEAVAVTYEGRQLSYGELNARANQLAHYLRARGVGPEVRVGICVERSLEMIVGLLGILKAGGAYVPLDPDYPEERLEFMVKDAQIGVLLTQERLARNLLQEEMEVICVENDWERISAESNSNPINQTGGSNVACMIYTSGSTGRPKGAMSTHGGLCNRLIWMQNEYRLESDDCVLQKTPFGFDVSIWEFFWPLLVGARLVVARPGGHREPAYLIELICEQKITTLHFVPSMLRVFIEEKEVERCDSMRRVICSGEALTKELVEEFLGRTKAQLHNLYGPTEASIDVTYWECQRGNSLCIVPIGRPIANTQMYIVDGRLEVVPVGVTGELCIGGAGLARGYLNRGDLTAERFVANPYSGELGARMYRTGDLGRYLEDGQIEFLGRRDDQIKLRGFRIELGEIESELARHAGVRESVVVVREDEAGQKRLVGYVVKQEGVEVKAGEWRAHLQERLPEYMVPGVFVELERLPLTPNGKVDRKSLPEPEGVSPAGEYVAPRNEVEELLAGVFQQVLGVERVGVEDNFFELGGHSLLATQLSARVGKVFGVALSLRSIFAARTVKSLSEAVEAARRNGQERELPALLPTNRPGALPLSFAQERLWFLNQLEPGSTAYNMPAAVRIKGTLQVELLERTLREIVKRHEVLRTRFEMREGRPVQVIEDLAAPRLEMLDLENELDWEMRIRELVVAEEQEVFDLVQGPLLRLKLVRLGAEEHVLFFATHHIVSDEWSRGVFIKEFTELYEAFGKGEPSPLKELSIQYGDYAVWQRGWLQGEVLEKQLGYWREQLKGAPAVLELPADRSRPAVKSFAGASQAVKLSAELTRQLKALSQREGLTLFMTLLAGFKVFLMRYSGQEDIVVGTPIANRNRMEIEDLIGFFVNTLVLRTDLSGDPSLVALLKRVREVALEAYAHQDVPFELLVAELKPERDLSRSPLFQVMIVLQNAPGTAARKVTGLEFAPVSWEGHTAKFDLTLLLEETAEGLSGAVEYNTDLFDAGTIERMLGHYERLLEEMVQRPQARLSELAMMSEAERRQVLEEWNDTRREYPRDKCIHELFEEQVERRPEAVAVTSEGRQLSYGELNARANQLAHYLRARGVGPEVRVGICVERSLEMIVGLLGILKAGGAYVPLDPQYPAERLAYMLRDAQVKVLVTQEKWAGALGGYEGLIVRVEREAEAIRQERPENTVVEMAGENLAYVIYTSGSTGRPKGVAITQGGLLNLVCWHMKEYGISACDRATQVAGIGFDASVWEIWPYLAVGASLNIPPEFVRNSPAELQPWLIEQKITISFLPTPLAEVMVEMEWPAEIGLRVLLTGGDQLRQHPKSGLMFRLVNHYGPTEATVLATCGEVDAGQKRKRRPTIGRPIANTQMYIVDGRLEVVPVGVTGELYIGGAGLARGYLNRGDLTAERFVANPYSGESGARMYRTGDLGRYLEDGQIEFLGRRDDQIKLRGFRIELGEIESELARHAGVRESVVVVREDEAGQKRLVGYVVKQEGVEVKAGEWRAHLQERLPEYMVPGVFVELERLPLTPNGKVDRKSLPEPEGVSPAGEYVAPRNEVEELLAGVFQQVLGVERVGVEDNFFELGGHSLLAVQVIARVTNTFQVELELDRLFEAPTIAGFATIVKQYCEEREKALQTELLTRILSQTEDEAEAELDSLPMGDQIE